MTFSPIISAVGTASDPTPVPGQAAEPAPDPGHADPAGPRYADATAGSRQDYAAAGPGQDHAATAYSQDSAAAGAGQEDGTGLPWPNQSYLELGALPTAAPCARLHTKLVLWEWDLGTLVQTAALVVSELVSNAVQASLELTGSRFAGQWAPGIPPVRVWLSADDHRVVIQVWDGSDLPPVPQPVAPEADSGRGLLLVGALSAEWGCYTPEKSSGKVVWAVVAG
jgi:anti-sigma regulatory factor (Ser/Thr protein kinase)